MKAILSAPGSRGDVNPMVAIGSRLRSMGWEVVISLAENYADLARQADLVVEPVISRERFDRLTDDPHMWKPFRGARKMLGTVAAEFMVLHREVIDRHHQDGHTVLISHPLDLASRIYRESHPDTPLVDVHLAPSMFRTYEDPPRMSPWWWEVRRPPWLVRLAYQLIDRFAVDPVIARQVNQMRAKDGLSPRVSRIIDQWWFSPDRILAMYPSWFAPATKSFLPQLVHCGFPLDDGYVPPVENPESRSGNPVVFTAGTAHRHTREFFQQCASVCQTLKHPGLLCASSPESFPGTLPELVQTSGYVPFGELFRQVPLVVHHGGIGTTSQCLAAGVPQLIRPMAYDQFDNASHIERLGVGRWLRRPRQLAELLGMMLADDTFTQRSQQVSQQLSGQDAVGVAAEQVVEVANAFRSRSGKRGDDA